MPLGTVLSGREAGWGLGKVYAPLPDDPRHRGSLLVSAALLPAVLLATELLSGLPPAAAGPALADPDVRFEPQTETALLPERSRRQRRVQGRLRRGIHELKDPAGWPAEPPTPAHPLDAARFEAALVDLCATVAPREALPEIARLVWTAATGADVDPFLLGALIYRQSRCRPAQKGSGGLGLLQIQPGMFQPGARLPFPREHLAKEPLLDPAHNLAVGAALLKMWEDEHPVLDAAHPSTPHRTGVAHFIWGDRVWGATAEDRVLTARRQLLERYQGRTPVAQPSMLGFSVVSPLDGAPRLGTSGPGADRDGGARVHRGLDIDAAVGEPVRAVADGVVQFAGVDLPGRLPARHLAPKQVRRWRDRRSIGPGGIFVRVLHDNGVRTGYFHLSSFSVVPGQVVRAGEVIGTVGRSGMKVSNSHLHLEVQRHGELLDPAKVLESFVLPPEATLTHELAMAEKKQRLDRERRARRRASLRARRHLSSTERPAPEIRARRI
jgi:hypothetical protein